MPTDFTAYKINKIVSLGWVLLVIILSSLWLGYTETQWQFILISLITFGYAHFIIGFIYQLKSFARKPNPKRHYLSFVIISVITLIFAEMIFALAGFVVALFVGFAYFLLHGLFNEQTLIKKEAGFHVPLIYIWSLAIFIMTLLTYTVPDPTFLFDRTLSFIPADNFILTLTFVGLGIPLAVFPYIFWSGMALSFLVLLLAWKQSKNSALTIFLAVSYVLIILATIGFGALPYIYMYFFVIGYHFMTWFLFYFRQMKGRPGNALRDFSILHILILAPFAVGGWLFFTNNPPDWSITLFDYKYFVIATYVHISTSFMNDAWFQQFQDWVFVKIQQKL